MQIDIRSNVKDVSRWLTDAQRKQLPFATMLAMTKTAQDVKVAELSVMKQVFDRPTPYTLNALRVVPATRGKMIASVEFKEFAGKGTPAKRFLNPEVHGGGRSHKSHERQLAVYMQGYNYAVPATAMSRDSYGNVKGAVFRRILSQLKVSSDPMQNATGSARSRKSRKSSQFFVKGRIVFERKGKTIKPALIFTRAPAYRKRFPFYETGARVVAERFNVNFEIAFQRAMATSRKP